MAMAGDADVLSIDQTGTEMKAEMTVSMRRQ